MLEEILRKSPPKQKPIWADESADAAGADSTKPLRLNSEPSEMERWWARWASNPGPADYESAALTRLSYGPTRTASILVVSGGRVRRPSHPPPGPRRPVSWSEGRQELRPPAAPERSTAAARAAPSSARLSRDRSVARSEGDSAPSTSSSPLSSARP